MASPPILIISPGMLSGKDDTNTTGVNWLKIGKNLLLGLIEVLEYVVWTGIA